MDKFGFVVAAVTAQGRVGLALALFVALQALNNCLHGTSARLPSHSIVDDLSFHAVLLFGESEGHQGGIVQFHSPPWSHK